MAVWGFRLVGLPARERKERFSVLEPYGIQRRSGRVGMTTKTVVCAGRRVSRSSSPLIRLVAEVLATSCGYHMSEDVIKLLERDADFLAALQWLVLHTLSQPSSS